MFSAFKGDPHIIQYELYKTLIERLEGTPVNQILLDRDKFAMVDKAILGMQQGMHERQIAAEDGAGQSGGGDSGSDSGGKKGSKENG